MRVRAFTMVVAVVAMSTGALMAASPAAASPPVPVQIATAGDSTGGHSCAVMDSGSVECWGANSAGQLGDGTTTARSTAVAVVGLGAEVVAVTAGPLHTCALTAGGAVKCWGQNVFGQLGDGTTTSRTTPVDVVGLGSGVTAVSAGGNHTCAVMDSGGVRCWGANSSGEVGDGSTTARSQPVDVSGLGSGVTAVSAGLTSTCAVVSGGAKCWGANNSGQVGDGTITNRSTPTDVFGLASGVGQVTAGDTHSCAVMTDGSADCWGANISKQLGDGTIQTRLTPVVAAAVGSNVTSISIGPSVVAAAVTVCVGTGGGGECTNETVNSFASSTCILTTTGTTECFGYNFFGQLGDGTLSTRSTPAEVHGLGSGVTALSTGIGWHGCAIAASAAHCWGSDLAGELGNGSTVPYASYQNPRYTTPVDVTGLSSGVTALDTGLGHSCAVVAGTAKCWGSNTVGELGDGTTTARSTPVDVVGLGANIATLDAGYTRTCAITVAGSAKCWGGNDTGALGDGTTTRRLTPVDVTGLGSGVSSIAAGGYFHTCALTGGAVKCWGYNLFGQLGDGTTTNRLTPVDVAGLGSGVVAVATGGYDSCAVMATGAVKCWGYNVAGQLGDGTTTNQSTPTDVVGLGTGAVDIAMSGGHACVLLATGGVKCWGANNYGQLGDGTTSNQPAPVDVVGMGSDVAAVRIGPDAANTCALMTSGAVKCWGDLGMGNQAFATLTPADVPTLGAGSGVTGIDAGKYHRCALTTDGAAKCWGSNGAGQLGIVGVLPGTVPVDVLGLTSGPTVPGAPTVVVATAGNGQVDVSWTAPADDGGSTVTDYEVSVLDGGGGTATGVTGATSRLVGSSATTFAFTGLTNGTAYTFRVAAKNSIGTGAQSVASDVTTPGPPPVVKPGLGSVLEGNTGTVVMNIPVTLSAGSASTVTVHYATIDTGGAGIATPGTDYVATSGTLSFAPGETSKSVPITVDGDLIDEPPALYGEWALLAFSSPVGATVDTSFFGLGVGIIFDDDQTPVISPGVGGVTEGNAGSVTLTVPVTLSNPSAVPITVGYSTVDTGGAGIATSGVDYLATSGTLTFAPGETSKSVSITVYGDTLKEPPALYGEWILVSFSHASASGNLDNRFFGLGLGIILDDD